MSRYKIKSLPDIMISTAPNGWILREVSFNSGMVDKVLGVFNEIEDLNIFIKSQLQPTTVEKLTEERNKK